MSNLKVAVILQTSFHTCEVVQATHCSFFMVNVVWKLPKCLSDWDQNTDDTTLMAENEEELKSLLMKVKEESEKAGLKPNIQKNKIMASGPINSWQINGETMETVTDLSFLGSEITADGDCSHEMKRRLLLQRKVMTNLDSILKSSNITLPKKVHPVKAMVFSVTIWM